ncbi:MAG: hypothetical protein QM529_04325, partial [Hydrotalea sp.]|nr:hypothetical protein [Hydrotalea sp.]
MTAIYVVMLAVLIIANIFYLRSVYKKETILSRTTWVLLTVMSTVAFLQLLHQNQWQWNANVLLYPFILAVAQLVVAMVALKHGRGDKHIGHTLVIYGFVLLSILLWLITDNPTLGLVTILFANSLALYPTLHKTWHQPAQESLIAWSMTRGLALLSLGNLLLGHTPDIKKYIFSGYMVAA